MMRHLYKTLLFFAFALPLSSMAQSLEIVQHFKMDEYATVLTTYKNEFGHRQKKGIDDSFPFAVLEVNLEGDERSVTLAKEKITLNLGTQYMVEGLTKEYNNKIVFLISSRLRNVYMECGDGCKEQVIFEGMQLQPDRIYYGTVRYTPAEENRYQSYSQTVRIQDGDTTREDVTNKQYIDNNVSLDVQTKSSYRDYVENAKIKTLVMGQVGYSIAPQLSYGLMIGQMYKGIGWFVSGRSNFNFHNGLDIALIGEDEFFNGNISKSHLVVHGGFMLNFLEWAPIVKNKFNTCGMYIGLGYGNREVAWQTTDGEWIAISSNTYWHNCSFNGGLFGSVCGVTLSVGAAVLVEGYAEVEVGIGYMF